VLAALAASRGERTAAGLLRDLGLPRASLRALRRILAELERNGELCRSGGR
jgi:DNA-binding IclR family transcriptional regulator